MQKHPSDADNGDDMDCSTFPNLVQDYSPVKAAPYEWQFAMSGYRPSCALH